jgi:hypothetical protein
VKGLGSSFQALIQARMSFSSARRLLWTPRRSFWSVSRPNHHSTWLSQELGGVAQSVDEDGDHALAVRESLARYGLARMGDGMQEVTDRFRRPAPSCALSLNHSAARLVRHHHDDCVDAEQRSRS